MNFSSMEYFLVLAQERNFTRAAERLHITQQSLSSHIIGHPSPVGFFLQEMDAIPALFIRYLR